MKSLSAGMTAHLAGEVTTLASCWKVVRTDGASFHFTDHDQPLTIDLADGDGPQVYIATSSYTRSAVKSRDTLAVDNLDVLGVLDDASIDRTELAAGLFDYAEVFLFLINHQDTSQGPIRQRRGRLGETTVTESGWFTAELRGLAQLFARGIGELYTPTCRADLGDARCRVPIDPAEVERSRAYAPGDTVAVGAVAEDRIFRCVTAGTTDAVEPVYDPTVGNTTIDGTAGFIAEEAWQRSVTVTAVDGAEPRKIFAVATLTPNAGGTIPGRDHFPDGSLNGGVVRWLTGENAGKAMEIRAFAGDDGGTIEQTIELYLDMPFDIQLTDTAVVHRGCLKRVHADCRDVFDNALNFRGEPFVPGQDLLFDYADAR